VLSSTYDPKKTEGRIYKKWLASGCFNPDKLPQAKAKSPGLKAYTIHLPPPNITGSLHMGHALNAVLSDILIRYHRMNGCRTAWLPGTDHAGIATQNVIEKELRKKGLTRWNLGREKFTKQVWAWKKKYGNLIIDQLEKLGASCDWSRLRFTMDPLYIKAVQTAFLHYHNQGLIYRDQKTINWCRHCQTGISDLEVEYREENAKLYYIKYGPFVLATVRPETKFGDTALAVHPDDKRYQKYIGKEIEIESLAVSGSLDHPQKTKIKVKVVADRAVDPKFGTGVIKVTPAHDITDFEISQRHHLPMKQVINERGIMNEQAGKYAGLKVEEAREKIAADLKLVGLLTKVEPYYHRKPVCYRCQSTIEPLPSWQWFLKMSGLAKKAAQAVRSRKTKIVPKNFEKIYFNWLTNTRDWCISRQLWWGQRLPVWFHENKCLPIPGREKEVEQCEEVKVSLTEPKCQHCAAKFIQSEDVFDTWFSSALWPFAGLAPLDQKSFYPSSILITARDIINLWVGRMIFSGLEFKKAVPFPITFIHPTVLTKKGERMSKSLGTGVDPLELIERYGADAVRFALTWQIMGAQDMHWSEEHAIAGKKFANKLWNITRFVLNNVPVSQFSNRAKSSFKFSGNRTIIKKLNRTQAKAEQLIQTYQFGQALHLIHDFVWHEFADKYVEASKKNLTGERQQTLGRCLLTIIKLLHPFMPFVTEEIYQQLPIKKVRKLLLVEQW